MSVSRDQYLVDKGYLAPDADRYRNYERYPKDRYARDDYDTYREREIYDERYRDYDYDEYETKRSRSKSPSRRSKTRSRSKSPVKKTVVVKETERRTTLASEPLVKGDTHTHHIGTGVRPIFETTTKGGMHLRVSENTGIPHRNPLTEVVSSLGRRDTVHNEQLERMIDRSIESLEKERRGPRLDDRGRVIAKDTQELLEATERLIHEKNQGEYMQRFVGKSARAAPGVTKMGPSGATLSKGTKNVYDYARRLTTEILRSGDFRQIAVDTVELFREALSETKRPTGTYGSQYGSQYVPTGGYGAPAEGFRSPTAGYGSQHPTQYASQYPSHHEEKVLRSEFEVKNLPPRGTPYTASSYGGSGRIPASEPYVEHVVYKEVLGEHNIPQPREYSNAPIGTSFSGYQEPYYGSHDTRQRMADRYLNILKRISAKEEFKSALGDIFKLFSWMSKRSTSASNTPEATSATEALSEARLILEQFAGREPMDKFIRHFNTLMTDVKQDPELLGFLRHFRKFSKEITYAPSFDETRYRREAYDMWDHGLNLLDTQRWSSRFREVLDDLYLMLDNIRSDSTTSNFGSKLQQLLRDLTTNREGKLDVNVMEDSLHQLKMVLLPLLRTHLESIPIDRIEVSSPKFDAIIEDVTITGADILPDHLDIRIKNRMKLNLQEAQRDFMTHKLILDIDRITPRLHNLKFYIKTKMGIKMEDYGVVDVALRGSGMSVRVVWKILSLPGQPARVHLDKVRCMIDDLHVHFVKERTKHGGLDNMAMGMLNTTIRKKIANAVAEYIQVKATQLDDYINQFLAKRPVGTLMTRANDMVRSQVDRVTSSTKKMKDKSGFFQRLKEGAASTLRRPERYSAGYDRAVPTVPMGQRTYTDRTYVDRPYYERERGWERPYERPLSWEQRGYEKGYENGYPSQFERGYDRGYPTQFSERGYERGYPTQFPERGYEKGHPSQFQEKGFERGYERGHPSQFQEKGYERDRVHFDERPRHEERVSPMTERGSYIQPARTGSAGEVERTVYVPAYTENVPGPITEEGLPSSRVGSGPYSLTEEVLKGVSDRPPTSSGYARKTVV